MTPMRWLWLLLAAAWITTELVLVLASQHRLRRAELRDAGTDRLLWRVTGLGVGLGLVCKTGAWLPIPGSYAAQQSIGLVLFGIAVALRLLAVATLGPQFTTRVAIVEEHRFIRSGPYHYLRHPAYTGLLLAFFGAGVAMGDLLAIASLVLPLGYVLARRIRVEEHALTEQFGDRYRAYCAQTKRLIPGVW